MSLYKRSTHRLEWFTAKRHISVAAALERQPIAEGNRFHSGNVLHLFPQALAKVELLLILLVLGFR